MGPARPRFLERVEGIRALRHRNFRLYWFGQMVSLMGTQMQRVAQAWLVLTLTNDPLMLGVAATAQFGPILFFGLLGGVAADALPKRKTLITTQVIAMVLALFLGVLSFTGSVQVWQVLLVALCLGFTTVLDMPTRQSFVIEMVGRRDLPNAVALQSAAVNGAKVIGPAIAGLTIGAVGVSAAFILNGLSFLAVIAGLLAMRSSELRPRERAAVPRTVRAVAANLAEGLSYVRRTPIVFLALVVLGVVSTVAINFTVVIPPLARDVLHANASGYGFLMSALGIGSVLAATTIAFRGRPGIRTILGGGLLLGVLETLLAFSGWMPTSLVLMFGMGLGSIALSMSTNTVIQVTVPDVLRGRVMAVYLTLWGGTTPIGGLIMGAIASTWGTPIAIITGGLAAVITVLVSIVVAMRLGLFRQEVAAEGVAGAGGRRAGGPATRRAGGAAARRVAGTLAESAADQSALGSEVSAMNPTTGEPPLG